MRPTEIDPLQYASQLEDKQAQIVEQFSPFAPPALEVFASVPLHYRMRAEFRTWHDGDDLYHIMFDPINKEKYRVDHFPPACELINELMKVLMQRLKANDILRRKLFQIDYLATLSGQAVVSLIYHRQLDDAWQKEAEALRSELRQSYDVEFIGRARKQKLLLNQDFVWESLTVGKRKYKFKQTENSFTQPNAGVNSQMIEWAIDASNGIGGDLLELYCGLGNFSLPLASQFNRVLGTEIAKPSVEAAQDNIQANDISNVEILRISSEEFSDPASKRYQSLMRQGMDLDAYDFTTVLVDPPRAGLDKDTEALVSRYDNILYISCNPDTLKDNLQTLCETHEIARFALFDQFPYTHHAECGVLLQRRV